MVARVATVYLYQYLYQYLYLSSLPDLRDQKYDLFFSLTQREWLEGFQPL